ncbi:MAG: alpha/beta fold hydrolase [Candidatus Eremiobacteraeota bacterium]|nr:alpha/beta fold hydrolase [Candidatus Eremiobacteraeota bacterium]
MMRAVAFLVSSLLTIAQVETPQPDHFQRLADKPFVVTTPRGSGVALYFSNGSLEGDPDAERALIVVHGVLRDADYYYDTGMQAVQKAQAANTIVISPQFVEAEDLKNANVPAAALRWSGQWPGGVDATSPAPISTYDVFDAILARLADRSRFPKLREIVLAGHSAGGQIVQRYAVVGNAPQLDPGAAVRVHLIVANPSSYFYFDDTRPVPQTNCADFDQWRYGIAGAPRYVTGTAAQLEARYVKRDVTYLLGTADTNPNEDDLDRTCGGEAQGPYRFARGKNFIAYIKSRHPAGTNQDYAFVVGVPHDNRKMFASECGIAVIFGRNRAACGEHAKI